MRGLTDTARDVRVRVDSSQIDSHGSASCAALGSMGPCSHRTARHTLVAMCTIYGFGREETGPYGTCTSWHGPASRRTWSGRYAASLRLDRGAFRRVPWVVVRCPSPGTCLVRQTLAARRPAGSRQGWPAARLMRRCGWGAPGGAGWADAGGGKGTVAKAV